MLLTFSVTNFRCFTDEAVLDLVRPSLKTLMPGRDSSWIQETQRAAVIYGANASGKSTLLDALEALHRAIGGARGILYQPDRFRPGASEPTTYRLEFTAEGGRFAYTVTAEVWGISSEELWEVGRRWKKVFARRQPSATAPLEILAGPSLRGANREVKNLTSADDLFLGVAFHYRHETLFPLVKELRTTSFVHHSDDGRLARIRWLTIRLADDPQAWGEISAALSQMADLGILRIELEEQEIPPKVLEEIRSLAERLQGEDVGLPDELLRQLRHSLVFIHRGPDGAECRLGLGAQSEGALTWLATAGPAIQTLRQGGVLVVDELDASLHPHLASALIEMFQDPDLNTTGAQIIATTHDASLLGNTPTPRLEAAETWFCEKDADGSSSIYSLADFTDLRRASNKQKRYLVGALGGVPRVDPSGLRRLLAVTGD
ncbi:AAA family ATPase [Actinomyces gaoshouyii]|uniref:AAA family ATPase n=1 Tax=Actinomyces gaoshouyii TaxID=1960083 RepID=UPI0009BD3DE2|nr:ATP-binding protein [Actinomyces gaoshouyii]ARD41017.1 AAA family ATPase [Actinomyces gaoshouyii]